MEVISRSKMSGVGAYLPERVVYSDEIMDEVGSIRFGTPTDYISKRIGIKERRVSVSEQQPSDLAIEASIVAMCDAGVGPGDIDLILYCGIDRDWQEPATAHRVQSVLGIKGAACLDVTNACHGFLNGLSIADAFIANGSVETVLVCTGEKPSMVTRETISALKETSCKQTFRRSLGALTVGDAGGAMIVQKKDGSVGFQRFNFHSEGRHAKLCYYKHTSNGLEGQMLMKDISQEIIRLHSEMIDASYRGMGWAPQLIDRLYCHQVGAIPHRAMCRLSGVSIKKSTITYDLYGNLTSATIPVNIYLNRPEVGTKALVMGTGSGLSICQMGIIF